MYIIVLSKNPKFPASVISYIDTILVENNCRNLTLYSFHPFTLSSLKSCFNSSSYYYVLIDGVSYPDILPVLGHVDACLTHYVAGILSNTDQYATDLLNSTYPVYGFINLRNKAYKSLLTSLLKVLNQNYQDFSHGLCVKKKENTYVLSYNDIFYIETEKGTHRCLIYHTNGIYSFRATIKNLICDLDSRFLIVRSSTIANLETVKKIDPVNRILYFTDTLCCTYSQIYYPTIKNILQGTENT